MATSCPFGPRTPSTDWNRANQLAVEALKAAKQMARVMQNEYEEKLEESKTVLPECKVFNRKAPKTFHLEYKALVADLLASRLDATQVVHVLETVVTAVRPDQIGFKHMQPRHARNINLAMVRIAKTIGAIEIMECNHMLVSLDLMSDDQQEYGAAVLKCKMPDGTFQTFSIGGVWKQASKRASDSVEYIVRAFKTVCQYVQDFKDALDKKGVDSTFLPESGADAWQTSLLKTEATMQDHATVAKKTSSLLFDKLSELAGVDIKKLETFCWNHKRSNFQKMFEIGSQRLFATHCVSSHFKKTINAHNSFLFQIFKEFGNLVGSYAKGSGVSFQNWLKSESSIKYRGLKRHIGNRNDITFENSMIVIYLWDAYKDYLLSIQDAVTADGKGLKAELLSSLQDKHMLAQTLVKARLMVNLWQPLRCATNDLDLKIDFLGMGTYAIQLNTLFGEGASGDYSLLTNGYRAFDSDELYKRTQRYSDRMENVIAAVFAPSESCVEDLVKEYFQAGMCEVQAKCNSFLKQHLLPQL